jgi:site-specific recombinase XerD
MAQAKFTLKEPNGKADTLIYLFYNFNTQRLKYSFGQKINPKFWNFEKQRVKETKAFPEYTEFNSMLNSIETTINNIYRKLINDDIVPTPALLRETLDNTLLGKKDVQKQMSLFSFIDSLISNSTKKQGTIIHYKQTLRVLKEYCSFESKNISFEDINLNFYESFVSYLYSREYAENTIGGYIKNIKVFMNEAIERKLTNNTEFRSRRFKKTQETTDKIYLNLEEVQKLYLLDLSGNKKLEKVRDLFIVACFTGLRFSDLTQITPNNFINNGSLLKIKTEKTGEFVVIPLHKTVHEIFRKYKNEIPNIISNQKMNDYLKEIAKIAGFNEKISNSITKGGIKKTVVSEKWQLVTVHTARRSFATNMYLLDIPTISIMKITGHRTEKAFLLYIKFTQEENANKLLNHPFFKQ